MLLVKHCPSRGHSSFFLQLHLFSGSSSVLWFYSQYLGVVPIYNAFHAFHTTVAYFHRASVKDLVQGVGPGKMLIDELKEGCSDVCLNVSAEWWVEACNIPWPVSSFFLCVFFDAASFLPVATSLEGPVVSWCRFVKFCLVARKARYSAADGCGEVLDDGWGWFDWTLM